MTSKQLDLHGQSDEKIDGCHDLAGWGAGGVEAMEPNFKRTSLGVVPDAQYRKSGNIKKLTAAAWPGSRGNGTIVRRFKELSALSITTLGAKPNGLVNAVGLFGWAN